MTANQRLYTVPGSDMVGYYDFVVCTTTSIVHPVKLLEAGHYLLVVSTVTFLQARTVFDASSDE